MPERTETAMLQFLTWLAAQPRTYRDVMDAWRSTCPRLSLWEDALGDGLIELANGDSLESRQVILTARGSEVLGAGSSLR